LGFKGWRDARSFACRREFLAKEFADWEAELEVLYSGFPAGSVGLALLTLLFLRLGDGIGPIGESDAVGDARRAEEIAMIRSAAANPKDQTEKQQ
jgi:hypothetical protein